MRLNSGTLALLSLTVLTGCVDPHAEVPSQYPNDPSLYDQISARQQRHVSREPSNVEVPFEQARNQPHAAPVSASAVGASANNQNDTPMAPPPEQPQPDEVEGG